jgi:hypothetical protein
VTKKLVERMSESLAARSSRRGFLSAVGKVVLGAGAFAAGAGGLSFAVASNCCTLLCPGNPDTCPAGLCEDSADDYCCHASDGYYTCSPCVNCTTRVAMCYTWTGPRVRCPLTPL